MSVKVEIVKCGMDFVYAIAHVPKPADEVFKMRKQGKYSIEWTGPNTCEICAKRDAFPEAVRLVQ